MVLVSQQAMTFDRGWSDERQLVKHALVHPPKTHAQPLVVTKRVSVDRHRAESVRSHRETGRAIPRRDQRKR